MMEPRSLFRLAALLCATAFLTTVCLGNGQPPTALPASKTKVAAPADAKQPAQTQALKTRQAPETKLVTFTGSYIPVRVRVDGKITEGGLNLLVIDRTQIDESGAATVSGVLASQAGVRMKGR